MRPMGLTGQVRPDVSHEIDATYVSLQGELPKTAEGELDHDTVARKALDDASYVRPEGFSIGMGHRAGDGVGNGVRIVASVAIGEDQGGGEVELVVAGAGAVAEQEAPADGMEAEVGAGAGVPAALNFLLHIT
jgi:hypothetical protein